MKPEIRVLKTDIDGNPISWNEVTKRENGTLRIRTFNKEKSRTQQQFKDHCDINNIIKKYEVTGVITHLNKKTGQYIDATQLKDYHSSLQTVIDAKNLFMQLPSDLRAKFENDPQKLIDFVDDKNNYDDAVSLGLIPKKSPSEISELTKAINKNMEAKNDDSNDEKTASKKSKN